MPTPPPDIDEVTVGTGASAITAGVKTDAPFRFGIDRRGPSRTVTYLVDGAQAAQFCDGLLGIGAYSSLPFGWPQPHRYPNNTALMCERVDGVPLGCRGPDPQLMRAEYAEIVADYAVPYYDVYGEQTQAFLDAPVPWSSLESEGSTEQVSVQPDGLVTVGSTSLPLDAKTTVEVATCEYIFRRMMMPTMVDFDAICKGLAGKVNDGTFFQCPRGTLRFVSWHSRKEYDSSGNSVQEFTMVLRWREIEHNFVIEPESLDTWVPVEDSAGNRKYRYADFSPILSFGVIP